MARWLFLTARPLPDSPDLGGIEQAVLHLGAALTARGHTVSACASDTDVVVAVNDARLLPGGHGRRVVWFHNEVTLWREWRRGRLGALRRLRPDAVFCGARQARQASHLLPLNRRLVVPHGLPAAILEADASLLPPAPLVIFTSQAYRGLSDVIDLWRRWVAPHNPAARLCAYIAPGDLGPYQALAASTPSIAIRPRIANAGMPALLRRARLLVAPGHPSETFCLAAAEAVAMGVPVVTFGRGALAERVEDGKTGCICRNPREMADRILGVLGSDVLWQRLHAHGLAHRSLAGWGHVAELWEQAFLSDTC